MFQSLLGAESVKPSELYLGNCPHSLPLVSGREKQPRRRQPAVGRTLHECPKTTFVRWFQSGSGAIQSKATVCRPGEWLLESWGLLGFMKPWGEKISKLNKMGMRGAVAERREQMTWQHARPKNLYWWCVSDVPFFSFCTTVGIIQRLRFWLWLQLYVNNVWVIFGDHFLATLCTAIWLERQKASQLLVLLCCSLAMWQPADSSLAQS